MQRFADGKVLVERDGAVTIVSINRPEVKNACDMETAKALFDVFRSFEADEAACIAVLTGVGDTFSTGGDLAEIASGKSTRYCYAGEDKGPTRRRLAKPVIAAVEGHAVAGGFGLAVWCDLRVASQSAVFGVFCRRFGGPMPNGATVRLPRIVGESRALDILMTGRPVDAREAHAIGLADRLTPKGGALAAARALAAELAALPQLALLSDRASALSQWDYDEETAIEREVAGSMPALEQQFQSGAQTFFDKRGA